MRKIMVAAVAALTSLAVAVIPATAQTPTAKLDVKLTPAKAGTKKKPKNSAITLAIENSETNRTMSRLAITLPRTLKVSGKGLTKCSESALSANGLDGCPRASLVGKGTASALLGVTTPTPSPLTFDVTAVVLGNKSIGFYLVGRELGVTVLAPGRVSGRKLIIEVPVAAQQPTPGLWAGLVSLQAKLQAKKGRNYLIASTGCKRRRHAFKADLTFVNNGVGAAGTKSATDTVTCRR